MENEIAVSGQLGIMETKPPIEKPEIPKTTGEPPQYTVHQEELLPNTGLLPRTGELAQAGFLMMGLMFLILILIVKSGRKFKLSAR
jgi:LPXTG-motif cell wall-anchored protein